MSIFKTTLLADDHHLCIHEPVYFCLSNRKFERLVGPFGEIVTGSVHKYKVIMSRPNKTSFDSIDGLPRL